jgi:HTH-type transcriptional regulator/antitoxin HipB
MAEPFQDRLAAGVRGRRMALRLSQRDLAELAGVSERFVRFVEQGKRTVQLDLLLALLDTLGLELQLATRTSPAARALAGGPSAVGLSGAKVPEANPDPADPRP